MNRLLAALVCLMPSVALAQRDAMVPDPDPEIERKSFIVAPGFEVTLFAADPMLAKPIQMNFDPQGRLWVATSEVYPQIRPGQVANDKILILEDTKGVGKADKVTVFADGLLIPTGVLPGDGGAYVANSTEILHLSASKPGGKADKRRVVLSGFGTEDTHHIIHTFRWGPDGAMYFNQSVYIHSHVETPHGTKRLNGGGIWRYEPKSQKLDVFVRGFWNPWGHQFDKYGNSFITDGAYGEGIVHGVPGASYPTGGNQAPRVLHGMNPGSPKFCGLEIISGRHFPDDWQGDCITNDFRGHRVCRFKLRDAGSTFESREMTEVIKSNHPAFRPIDCLMGPDGALYIADWYNPIIQHGEVDFRDDRRDHTHGRIWRVTAKGRPLVEKQNLLEKPSADLWRQLGSPEALTRNLAGRLLIERHQYEKKEHYFSDAQYAIVSNEVFNMGNPARFQSLAIGLKIDPQRHHSHFSPFSKADKQWLAAYVGCPNSFWEAKALVINSLSDPSPRLRLAALSGLIRMRQLNEVFYHDLDARVALKVLDHPTDPTLEYALRLVLQESKDDWLPELKNGKFFEYLERNTKKLAFALEAVQSPEVVKTLVEMLKAGKFPKEDRARLWLIIALYGDSTDVGSAFLHVTSEDATRREYDLIIPALQDIANRRKVKPDLAVVQEGFKRLKASDRLLLIGAWKLESERAFLETFSSSNDLADWHTAWSALVNLGGQKSVSFFNKFAGSKNDAERHLAIVSLAQLDLNLAATHAADYLSTSTSHQREAIIVPFASRKNGHAALAKALDGKTISPDVAKLGLQVVRAMGNPSPTLVAALTKAGNLTAKKEPSAEDIKSLTADVLKLGDAARGEAVFRRKEYQCFACHAIGGAGGQVGPDLTSIGASAQTDYLVDSLLLPNKAIKEGYHTINITLHSGKLVSGIKVREAGGELVLRDKDDKEIPLRVDEIESRRNGRSLMPDGLTDPLTRAELLDLVRFLGELGKIGPYEPTKARVVRTWEVADASPENLKRFRSEPAAVAAGKPESVAWSGAYSCVSGDLPLIELPSHETNKAAAPTSILRFRLKVTAAGEIMLNVNKLDGLAFFHGATTLDAAKPFRVEVGEPIITVLVNRSQRNDNLRITLDDVSKSTARAAVVLGK